MTTVKDVLDQKGRNVYSISPVASVYDALKLMADHDSAGVSRLEARTPRGCQVHLR